MATDSRLTLNRQGQAGQINLAVGQSDTVQKSFLTKTGVGISTAGDADIQGVPIAGFVESFIHDVAEPQNLEVDQVAQALLQHFRAMPKPPNSVFHVAGYRKTEKVPDQQVWKVVVAQNLNERINPNGGQGATWDGESDILVRLIQPVATVNPQGQVSGSLPFHSIPWGFFTLQDAIDFAVFAERSTIDVLRFLPRPKTVGGPIDVCVIKPTIAEWIQRKQLSVRLL